MISLWMGLATGAWAGSLVQTVRTSRTAGDGRVQGGGAHRWRRSSELPYIVWPGFALDRVRFMQQAATKVELLQLKL
jgi:hypothetical protein